MKDSRRSVVLVERIEKRIFFSCGQKVMLSTDLAPLYEEPVSKPPPSPFRLRRQAVERNKGRFPEDFMFQLTWGELGELSRSQFVILKRGLNIKYRPYAFTEHGVAMLSSVLNSERAIQVNLAIMRAFGKLREIRATHKDLAQKLEALVHPTEDGLRCHSEINGAA